MPFTTPGQMKYGRASPEAAGDADDADGLGHVLPLPTANAHAVGQMQPVGLGAQVNRGDLLAVARPLPASHPAGAQASFAMQPVHFN
jgi:predicted short-subunit dehydrogenase-like oxidoreductase (DUF2520 family)